MSNKNNVNMAGAIVKEGYEARVALQALERAGKCPNLHGHVHELMFCDKYNFNPEHFLKGEYAQLTKSTTAKMKDVIMMKGGKVIGHAQLKDTPSLSGIAKTIKKVNAGDYSKTKMLLTEETFAKVSGKTSQAVHSSGISSETTARVAGKALGKIPSMGMVQAAAKSGGVAGAAFGAGIEVFSSGKDWLDGKKDFDDVVIDVGTAAVKGGITGAGSAAAGSFVAGIAGALFSATAAPVIAGLAASCVVGSAISNALD